jgi:hypothetical protein
MTGTPGFWHFALKDFALKSYGGLDVLSWSVVAQMFSGGRTQSHGSRHGPHIETCQIEKLRFEKGAAMDSGLRTLMQTLISNTAISRGGCRYRTDCLLERVC